LERALNREPTAFINACAATGSEKVGGARSWRAHYSSWILKQNQPGGPAALPLFATGLGALGLLGWRRKRKAAAIAAA